MATQKVLKEIKTFCKGKGWDHIENILKQKRSDYAVKLLCHKQMDDKIYTEADLLKDRIMMMNSILNIPKIQVETEEEIPDSEVIKEGDDLDIGSVNDLFVTQE